MLFPFLNFSQCVVYIFKPPSMRACSSTPPKQNQDFVKEYNRTALMLLVYL